MELTVDNDNMQRKGEVGDGILASLCSCIGGKRLEENWRRVCDVSASYVSQLMIMTHTYIVLLHHSNLLYYLYIFLMAM